jgi:hypothetical protein
VTDWLGSLAAAAVADVEVVDTADSRTTWMRVPSRFCRTFSVTFMLRRRSVEKPDEDSVSVGELGQEAASRRHAAAASIAGREPAQARASSS